MKERDRQDLLILGAVAAGAVVAGVALFVAWWEVPPRERPSFYGYLTSLEDAGTKEACAAIGVVSSILFGLLFRHKRHDVKGTVTFILKLVVTVLGAATVVLVLAFLNAVQGHH